MLINKAKPSGNAASSFQPLCMLDTAGKVFEKFLQPRISQAVQEAGGLSVRQHGFCKNHSTLHTVREGVEIAEAMQTGYSYSWKTTILVTLDVKNAYNTMNWSDTIYALRETFRLPKYLLHMMEDYFYDRTLQYDTAERQRRKRLTAADNYATRRHSDRLC